MPCTSVGLAAAAGNVYRKVQVGGFVRQADLQK